MRHFFGTLLFFLVFVGPLGAQEVSGSYNGLIVDSIEFEGLERIRSSEMRTIIQPYLQKEFSDSLFRDLQAAVYALDYFEGAITPRLSSDEEKKTLRIVFVVKEKPSVSKILFEGDTVYWENDLRSAIALKEGDFFDRFKLSLSERTIKDMLIERGYLSAEITSELSPESDSSRFRVIFRIAPGTQSIVKSIQFSGISVPISDLKNVLTSREKSFFRAGLYKESNIPKDMSALVEYYQNNGYLEAKVVSYEANVSEPKTPKDPREVSLLYIIEEGQQFLLGTVEFEGNVLFPQEELHSYLVLPEGIFKRNKLQEGLQNIQKLYADNGYIFTQVVPLFEQKERYVNIKLKINEGQKGLIRSLSVEGNNRVAAYILLREIPLEEGGVFTAELVQQAILNLRNLNYIKNVIPNIQPSPTPGLVDVNFAVEESGSLDMQLGLSVTGSPNNPFPLSFFWRLTENNFNNTGYTLGLGVNMSVYEQSLDLSFSNRWFMGIPWYWSTSFFLKRSIETTAQDLEGPLFFGEDAVPDPFDSLEEYEEASIEQLLDLSYMNYELISIGFSGSTGYSFSTYLGRMLPRISLSTRFNYANYDQDFFRPADPYLRRNLHQWLIENRMGFSASWDGRDLYMAPQSGFFLSQSISFTGGILGGDVHFTRLETSFERYWRLIGESASQANAPWHVKLILALKTSYSFLVPSLSFDGRMQVQSYHKLYVSENFNEARGWGTLQDAYSVWKTNIGLSMPLFENFLWWDIAFFDMIALSLDRRSPALFVGPQDYLFSWGSSLRITVPQLPLVFNLSQPFYLDSAWKIISPITDKPYDFTKGWKFFISLKINF